MFYNYFLAITLFLATPSALFSSNDETTLHKMKNRQGTYSVVIYKQGETGPKPVFSFDQNEKTNFTPYRGPRSLNVFWPSQHLTTDQILINAALELGLPEYFFLNSK